MPMVLRFGTDGIRARADTVLTESVVRALGRAAAAHLGADEVAIGHDTRASGPALARALAEGFVAGGTRSPAPSCRPRTTRGPTTG